MFVLKFGEFARDQAEYDSLIFDEAQRFKTASSFRVVFQKETVDAAVAEEIFGVADITGAYIAGILLGGTLAERATFGGKVTQIKLTYRQEKEHYCCSLYIFTHFHRQQKRCKIIADFAPHCP